MKIRILSSITLSLTLVLCLLFLGVQGGLILIGLVVFFAQLECYQLLIKIGFSPCVRLGLSCGLSIVLGTYFLPDIFPDSFAPHSFDAGAAVLLGSIFTIGLSTLKQDPALSPVSKFMATTFGLLYIPFMFQFSVLLLKHFEQINQPQIGICLTLWIIAVVKFTDIGGLIIGKYFGRNKLLPHVSPKKTWEGAIGGMLLSILIGALFVTLFRSYLPQAFTPLLAGLLAIPIAVTSIASDLIESLIKRQAKVKDSGRFIPGFGGILDLVDSLLFSFPIGYLLLKYSVI